MDFSGFSCRLTAAQRRGEPAGGSRIEAEQDAVLGQGRLPVPETQGGEAQVEVGRLVLRPDAHGLAKGGLRLLHGDGTDGTRGYAEGAGCGAQEAGDVEAAGRLPLEEVGHPQVVPREPVVAGD